ncbi:MAG: hypothetical protein ACLPKI_06420 [Streptosporangiaceae bacterium]
MRSRGWHPGAAEGKAGAKTLGTTLAVACGGGEHEVMRYESSVISVSWIPSEAVEGILHCGMIAGLGHYDDPLPGLPGGLLGWRAGGGYGDGGCPSGSTTARPGGAFHRRMVPSMVALLLAWTAAFALLTVAVLRWRMPRSSSRWGRACGASRMPAA